MIAGQSNTGTPIGPCVFISFGGTGDLTKRKLIPALYNLRVNGLLPDEFAVVGIGRREMDHDSYKAKLTEDMKEFVTGSLDQDVWSWLVERIYYQRCDFSVADGYSRLAVLLANIDKERRTSGN